LNLNFFAPNFGTAAIFFYVIDGFVLYDSYRVHCLYACTRAYLGASVIFSDFLILSGAKRSCGVTLSSATRRDRAT